MREQICNILNFWIVFLFNILALLKEFFFLYC